MKKILISALSFSILLAGCGQVENKDEIKKEDKKEKKEVVYVSDTKSKEAIQVFLDDYGKAIDGLNHIMDTDNELSFSENFMSIADKTSTDTISLQQFQKENKVSPEYNKIITKLIEFGNGTTEYMNKNAELLDKQISGELSEEEVSEESKKAEDKFGKHTDIFDKEILPFLEKHDINTKEIDKASKGLNEESDDSNESSDEVDDATEDTISLNPIDDFKSKSKSIVNRTINAGPVEFTVESVEKGLIRVTDENEYNFGNTKSGEEAQIIILNVRMKNTTDANADYYADQYPITTDTGEQLDPSVLTGSDLVTEMKGDIESTGQIIYELKNSKIEDVKHIEYIAPSYNDPETMDEITPEQKIEIPLEK